MSRPDRFHRIVVTAPFSLNSLDVSTRCAHHVSPAPTTAESSPCGPFFCRYHHRSVEQGLGGARCVSRCRHGQKACPAAAVENVGVTGVASSSSSSTTLAASTSETPRRCARAAGDCSIRGASYHPCINRNKLISIAPLPAYAGDGPNTGRLYAPYLSSPSVQRTDSTMPSRRLATSMSTG